MPCRIPTWQSTLFGSDRSSHIGLTVASSSRPKAARLAVGRRKQREKIVLVLVAATTRADIDARGVIEMRLSVRIECIAMRGEPGCLDRLAASVDAEHVGAPDELEKLPVVEQRARVEVGDLGRGLHRPSRCVPLRDRRDRRLAGTNCREDLRRLLACAADRARSGDNNALHEVDPLAVGGGPAVDLLRVAEDDAAVRAAEPERVGHRDPDASPARARGRRRRRSPDRARAGSR